VRRADVLTDVVQFLMWPATVGRHHKQREILLRVINGCVEQSALQCNLFGGQRGRLIGAGCINAVVGLAACWSKVSGRRCNLLGLVGRID